MNPARKQTAALKFHPLAELLPMMSGEELACLTDDIDANGQREPIVLFEGKILDGRNRYAACLKLQRKPVTRNFDPKKEGTPLSYIVSKATHRHMTDSQKACAAVTIQDELAKQTTARSQANLRPGTSSRSGKESDKRVFGKTREQMERHLAKRPRKLLEHDYRIHVLGETKDKKRGWLPPAGLACAAEISAVPSSFMQERLLQVWYGVPAAADESSRSREQAGLLFGVSGRYVQDARWLRQASPDLFREVFNGFTELSRAKRAHQREIKLKALADKHQVAVASGAASGDAWEIVCDDCVQALRNLDSRPRLIVTDPPYNCGIDYGNGAKADQISPDAFVAWCAQWIGECADLLAEDGSIFIMMDARYQSEIWQILASEHLTFRNTILWHERFGAYQDGNFSACARFIHYFTKNKSRWAWNADSVRIPSDRQTTYGDARADAAGKVPSNVWDFPRICDNHPERIPTFPTQIPVALVERIVLAASDPGDLVLDPFNGSGTTGEACLRHGRKYLGIERNADYVAIARQRLLTVQASFQSEGK